MPVEADLANLRSADLAPPALSGLVLPKGLNTSESTILKSSLLFGLVDLYGYHPLAEGWFLAGWLRKSTQLEERPHRTTLNFSDGASFWDCVPMLLYPRQDVAEDAVGFVLFLKAPPLPGSTFTEVVVELGGVSQHIKLAHHTKHCPLIRLEARVRSIVALAVESPVRREMELLLTGAPDLTGLGYLESSGHNAAAGGWFISGWMSRPWTQGKAPDTVLLSFERHDVSGHAVAITYPRHDLRDGAQGVLLFVADEFRSLGRLYSVRWRAGDIRTTLCPIATATPLNDAQLQETIRSNLTLARLGSARDRLSNLVSRQAYQGADTLETLSPNFLLHIDVAIQCGAEGLVLAGWMLTRLGEILQMRLVSGTRVTPIALDEAIKLTRHDVIKTVAQKGDDDPNCGFLIYLPHALEPEGKPRIEVETQQRSLAFRNIDLSGPTGIVAIRKLLSLVDVRFSEARAAFDQVIGPAVFALNTARLTNPSLPSVVEYGTVPTRPKYSLIVPLYGRIDFVEYQLALFSAWPAFSTVEVIYVLDDPPRRREAQALFWSAYERFQIPFRAVLLERNIGFAPANNIGLKYAHGEYIVFLNSDVFPGTQDWLEQLSVHLVADPKLGIVAPLLLFEDGSVQHRGMYYERLPEFGNWYFCQHFGRAMRNFPQKGLIRPLAVTGACMMIRRDLILRVAGFEEAYVIGDFEDSDLCLRLVAMGYHVAIDPEVKLFHLERSSQANSGQGWRLNLTLYNAWEHNRRWETLIDEQQSEDYAKVNG